MNPAHVRNPFAWASASADSTYVIELRHLAVITLIIGTLMALVLLYVLHERRNAQRTGQPNRIGYSEAARISSRV